MDVLREKLGAVYDARVEHGWLLPGGSKDPRRILELPGVASRIDSDHLRSAARRHLRDEQYLEAVWAASLEPPAATW